MKPTCQIPRLFIFIVIAAFTTNCNSKTSSSNAVHEKLTGTWDWVQSTGGIEGITLSPATEGYKKTITFEKNGVYKEHTDGKQTSKTEFSVSQGKSIYTDTAYLVDFKNPGGRSIIQSVRFGGKDTLFLSDECYDCFENIYSRKN